MQTNSPIVTKWHGYATSVIRFVKFAVNLSAFTCHDAPSVLQIKSGVILRHKKKESMIEVTVWAIFGLFTLVTAYAIAKGMLKEITLEVIPQTLSIRISITLVNRK